MPAYLAMSYLYKRSNRFWHLLIRHRLTAASGGRCRARATPAFAVPQTAAAVPGARASQYVSPGV